MPRVIEPWSTPRAINRRPSSVRVMKRSGCSPKSAVRPARTRIRPSENRIAAPRIQGSVADWVRKLKSGMAPALEPHVELVDQLVVGEVLARAALVLDLPVHDHVTAVGDADRLVEVLLGHEDGQAVALLQLPDLVDRVDDEYRGKADRRLVDEQDLRGGHQRAGEREHLLLAAAHAAGELAAPLCKARESLVAERKVPGHRRTRGLPRGAEQQVFLDGQLREKAPSFRHERYAEVDDLLGRAPHKVVLGAVDHRAD